MKVLKFGGTSVGTVESLVNVKKIVESIEGPAVIVVSALGGITDRLIATARMAAEGDEDGYKESFVEIERRHRVVVEGLVPDRHRNECNSLIENILKDLERLYYGIYLVNDLSERVLDKVVSFGERLSSTIISYIIDTVTLLDSREFIKTIRRHGKHVLDNIATAKRISEIITPVSDRIILVPGFISTDSEGRVTNLGRGGSDYTAAIIAAELNAEQLEIWTDVDGFLTSDPRKITNARIIDNMSFVEAMELCNFGAKVVYPPTIYPVFHKNIPVFIKNTFNPSVRGTMISDNKETSNFGKVRGISSISDTCLMSVVILDRSLDTEVIRSKVFNALTRKGIDIFMSSLSDKTGGFSFAIRNGDAELVVEELELEFEPEISRNQIEIAPPMHNMSTIAMVGENLTDSDKLIENVIKVLTENGVKIAAASPGRSQSNVSVVVSLEDEKRSLQLIHDIIF